MNTLRDYINFILDLDLNVVAYLIMAIMIGYVIYIFLGILFEQIRMSWSNIKNGFKGILILLVIWLVYLILYSYGISPFS